MFAEFFMAYMDQTLSTVCCAFYQFWDGCYFYFFFFYDPVLFVNMNKRLRDIIKKYLSGSNKKAVAKAKKDEAVKENGALDEYFSKNI